jgi:ketosteroid isomerase-like protein
MRRHIFAVSALFTAACTQPGEHQATTSEADDVTAIKTLLQEYRVAVNAGDLDGKEMRPLYRAAIEENTFQFTPQADEVRVSGDLAFMRITYNETVMPKVGGEPIALHGNWLVILERQPDGTWKWWREMWSIYPRPEM